VQRPLAYVDQLLRGLPQGAITRFGELVRRSAKEGVPPRSLVELSIVVGEYESAPRCRAAPLQVPPLLAIEEVKGRVDGDLRPWKVTLRLICQHEGVRMYQPLPDEARTTSSLELSVEDAASLWCRRGPLEGSIVGLGDPGAVARELVLSCAYHLLDALIIVRTLAVCGLEEELRRKVAQLLVERGPIRDLSLTTKRELAKRRVLAGERIAVLDYDNLTTCEVRGVACGLASLLPSRWCIQPVRVLELSSEMVDGARVQTLHVMTAEGSSRRCLRHLDGLLASQHPLYCSPVLYETQAVARAVLEDLVVHLQRHSLRHDMQEVEL
jgi:hypothetical protein